MRIWYVMTRLLPVLGGMAVSACTPAYHVARVVPASDGKYDYISLDSAARTVYIGRETGVMTLNLDTLAPGWLIKRDNVAAPLIITGTDLMLTTNGGTDTATLLNRKTGAVLADIAVGKGPDGAIYSPQTGRAYIMNSDDETISVIDISKAAVVATWSAGGTPEAAAVDEKGHLFVNLEDRNSIAKIDITTGKTLATYALADCKEPTGLAYDVVTNRLIPACHNRVARLLDAATGADRGALKIGQGADGSLFDSERRLGFIPCIDGSLTIYHLDANGQVRIISTIKTADGARTAAFDPVTGQVYLPAAIVERDAAGDYVTARKDFKIVVVSAKK